MSLPALLVGWLHDLFATPVGAPAPFIITSNTALAFVTLIVGGYVGIALHELGHVAAARTFRCSIVEVRVGSGASRSFRLGRMQLTIGAVPNGGKTQLQNWVGGSASRVAVILAGPIVNVVLGIVCGALAFRPGLLGMITSALACQQFLLAFDSLMSRPPIDGLHQGSDGWHVWGKKDHATQPG